MRSPLGITCVNVTGEETLLVLFVLTLRRLSICLLHVLSPARSGEYLVWLLGPRVVLNTYGRAGHGYIATSLGAKSFT